MCSFKTCLESLVNLPLKLFIVSNLNLAMIEFLKEEFKKIGCTDLKVIAIATQVYLELCEVKRYWDIRYFYDTDLKNIFFYAKRTKEEEDSIFFPIEVSRSVSFSYLQNLFPLCKTRENKLIIVLVHSDSTCVYYQIFNGLLEPVQDSKNNHHEQSKRIDANLRKHKDIIEQAALCGIPVTLPTLKPPASTSTGDDT